MSVFQLALKKALLKAAEDGDLSQVIHLVEDRGVSPELTNSNGWSALHYAVTRGHLAVVMYLLGKEVCVNQKNERGMTPLHLAAFHEQVEIYEELMKAGAHLSLHQEDQDGKTPFSWKYGGNIEEAAVEECINDSPIGEDFEKSDFSLERSISSSSSDSSTANTMDSEEKNGKNNLPYEHNVDMMSEHPEKQWMTSVLKNLNSKVSNDICNEDVNNVENLSDTSSSMSESDITNPFYSTVLTQIVDKSPYDPYSVGRDDDDDDNDDGDNSYDDKIISSAGNTQINDDIMEYNESLSRQYVYTIGGIQYDWTPSLSERASYSAKHCNYQYESKGESRNRIKERSISISGDDFEYLKSSRMTMAAALKALRSLRLENAVDIISAGIMKDDILSGDIDSMKKIITMAKQYVDSN